MSGPFSTNNPGIGGIDELTSAEEAIIASIASLGTAGQALVVNGAADGVEWATIGGSGDVTAASNFGTDNVIIRSDGTSKGVQSTGISINDSDAISGATIDGDSNTLSNLDIGNEVDWAAAGDVTDASAFASGDKLLIFEIGVGLRKIDYDDLPGAGGGLSNIVEDTTPQLGGQLDVNGNAIGDGTNELLTFTEDASAVNHINIENEATGSGPILSAAGDDTNIDLNLSAKGSGNISLGNFTFDGDQTVGAGQDNYVLTYDNAGGLISLEAAASGGDLWSDPVDSDIVPDGDFTRDLGNASAHFQDIFVSRFAGADAISFVNSSNLSKNLLSLEDVASSVNYLRVSTSATGNAIPLTAAGTDTNVSINLIPQGSGEAQVGGQKIIDETDTASTTAAGIAELATTAEIDTGTDTGRTITPDALAGSYAGTKSVSIQVVEGSTDTATGDGQAYFTIPDCAGGMDLVSVHARVVTAGTTGTTDIQIHNVTQAADMLSTKLTIDSGETGSDTAATAAVIDTANDDVATNDLIRIDIDAVSTTEAQGLIVTLEFRLP